MAWTAELLAGSKFLAVPPSSGTTPAGGPASLRIAPQTETNRNASDLPADDYYGLIRISSPTAANSPQYVLSVLHVSGNSLSPIVRPGGLILVSTGAAITKQVLIFGSSLDKYNLAVGASSPDGLKWLSATPASGSIVSSSTPSVITVTASPLIAGLKPGLYSGEVNVTTTSTVIPPGFPPNAVFPAVNSPIAILLVVLPAGAKLVERSATTGCTPASLGMVQTGRPGGFSACAGGPRRWLSPCSTTAPTP